MNKYNEMIDKYGIEETIFILIDEHKTFQEKYWVWFDEYMTESGRHSDDEELGDYYDYFEEQPEFLELKKELLDLAEPIGCPKCHYEGICSDCAADISVDQYMEMR